MTARLLPREDGFAVEGELNFASVAELYAQSARLFQQQQRLRVDLSGVTRADSSGVALLVEWLRRARARGAGLELHNVPGQMCAIIRVTDLEDLLPVASPGA